MPVRCEIAGAVIYYTRDKTLVQQDRLDSPLLGPFDHAKTEAGYRLTRWADGFVVVSLGSC